MRYFSKEEPLLTQLSPEPDFVAIIQIVARIFHWKTKLKPQPNEKKNQMITKNSRFHSPESMNESFCGNPSNKCWELKSVGPTDLLSHNQTYAAGVAKNNCSECRLIFCSALILSCPFCKESTSALRQADWLLQQVNRHCEAWGRCSKCQLEAEKEIVPSCHAGSDTCLEPD